MSFPVMFTLPPSNRHELILLDTEKPSLKALNKQITATIASSVNCEEFMQKHKSPDAKEIIQEIKVLWNNSANKDDVWPDSTIVTEENFGAIIEVLKGGIKAGVLAIKVGKPE